MGLTLPAASPMSRPTTVVAPRAFGLFEPPRNGTAPAGAGAALHHPSPTGSTELAHEPAGAPYFLRLMVTLSSVTVPLAVFAPNRICNVVLFRFVMLPTDIRIGTA